MYGRRPCAMQPIQHVAAASAVTSRRTDTRSARMSRESNFQVLSLTPQKRKVVFWWLMNELHTYVGCIVLQQELECAFCANTSASLQPTHSSHYRRPTQQKKYIYYEHEDFLHFLDQWHDKAHMLLYYSLWSLCENQEHSLLEWVFSIRINLSRHLKINPGPKYQFESSR